MKISRTKIVGYLIAAVSVLNLIIHLLKGDVGSLKLEDTATSVIGTLQGLGLVFLREGVNKLLSSNLLKK